MAHPDQAPYRQAKILVTAENFGCGSSREGAVWALMDHGIRCVVGPSFADIFFENCFKNGVLALVLPAAGAASIRRQLQEHPGATISVDLERPTLTMEYEKAILAHESRRAAEMPWLT